MNRPGEYLPGISWPWMLVSLALAALLLAGVWLSMPRSAVPPVVDLEALNVSVELIAAQQALADAWIVELEARRAWLDYCAGWPRPHPCYDPLDAAHP